MSRRVHDNFIRVVDLREIRSGVAFLLAGFTSSGTLLLTRGTRVTVGRRRLRRVLRVLTKLRFQLGNFGTQLCDERSQRRNLLSLSDNDCVLCRQLSCLILRCHTVCLAKSPPFRERAGQSPIQS